MTARPKPRPVEQQQLYAALHINCGKAGRDGRWITPPHACYQCLRCHTTEGPVTGEAAVRAFVTTIRETHRATCPAHQKGTP